MREFLEIYDRFVVDFGAGSLEDLVPFLAHVYETAKFKNLVRMKEKMFSFITQKYNRHKESFSPGMFLLICNL